MEDCIFCKIVKGEIPCHKIYEDNNHLAFLDINPNTKGMTIVIPKKHYDSYVFDMPNDEYKKLLLIVKKVARLLDKKLGTKRIALVMEGMGINHAHIKLYPLHGLDKKFKEMWSKDKIHFDKYEGYISTQLGPRMNDEKLKKLAEEIREGKHR